MKHDLVYGFCRKHGIPLASGWQASENCVRPHDRNETDKHWEYKCAIFRRLFCAGQTVFTELKLDYSWRTGGARMRFPTADILWLEERILIELESAPTPKTVVLKGEQFKDFNLFVFDLRKESLEGIFERLGI